MGKVRTDIVADGRVPLMVFDELYRLRCVVNAPLRNRSVERIPHLLRDGLLFVPVAPCSNMAKSGMNPKTLQYLMGHSDISVTMNVYTYIGLDDA